jgi:hypothetical protein
VQVMVKIFLRTFLMVLVVGLFVKTEIVTADSVKSSPPSSLFKDLCPLLYESKAELCAQVQDYFFNVSFLKAPSPAEVNLYPVSNAVLGVGDSPTDKATEYRSVEDPNKMAAFAYCYFTFRKWLLPSITPDQMGTMGSGFSIIKSETAGYSGWLKTPEGRKCVQKVKSESEEDVVDLEKFFGAEKKALLFVNPLAVIPLADNIGQFKSEIKKLVDHERIHVVQGLCKSIDQWSESMWARLKPEEKTGFEKTYPGYKWNDTKIAGRESVAYTYEEDFVGFLKKSESLLKKCL